MAAAGVDTAYLAGFCGLPQSDLDGLVTSPTSDAVNAFLASIVAKAHEFEDVKAEQRRLDVELENAVHLGDTRARSLKANNDRALADLETLRKKLIEEGLLLPLPVRRSSSADKAPENARRSVEAELDAAKVSTSTSTQEVDAIKAKITRLETSNRETLALLDSKSTAHDRVAQELAKSQATVSAMRRSAGELQERVEVAESASNSSKFRESSLQSEIELLKKNNDWTSAELSKKTQEHSKFRSEKNARVHELTRKCEETDSALAASKRNEATLRQRVSDMSDKFEAALKETQQVREETARSEESFRAELATARRLTELQENSAKTAKRRVEQLEEEKEQISSEAAEEIGQLQAELETERNTRAAAERKVEEQEGHIQAMLEERQAAQTAAASRSRPSTPTGRLSARLGSPMRGAGSPPPSVSKQSAATVSSMYTEFNQMKARLGEEQRLRSRLERTVEDMMSDAQSKEPEIQELTQDKRELEAKLQSATEGLRQARAERDKFKSTSRKAEGEIAAGKRNELLIRQQIRDRDAQVKYMTAVINLYEHGQAMNEIQKSKLERLAKDDFSSDAFAYMSDSDRFISENLVTFGKINELVQTNERLLDLTRKLSAEMEGEDVKLQKQHQEQLESRVKRAEADNDRMSAELESVMGQLKSFVIQRDALQRRLDILKSRDRALVDQPSDQDSSAAPIASFEGPTTNEAAVDLKEFQELATSYDSYKRQATAEFEAIKKTMDRDSKDKASLQAELARVKSQIAIASERQDMIQQSLSASQAECQELRGHAQSVEKANATLEFRLQQNSENLTQANELADTLRSENANIKAERDLWKRIEARFTEDIKALSEERARLNKLVSDSQSLSNQRESTDAETRRGLQSHIESLDAQLQATKTKAEEEIQEAKQLSRRREMELDQSRSRMDDLVKALNLSKEELASAKTLRDQLQISLDELKAEVRTNNAEDLNPRPTKRRAVEQNGSPAPEAASGDLQVKIEELTRTCDELRKDLDSAHEQIDTYKGIAQTSEESRQGLEDAHAEYIEDMEKVGREQLESISDLKKRLEETASELSEAHRQQNSMRDAAAQLEQNLEQQKLIFQAEAERIRDDADRYQEHAKLQQEDARAQAQIAMQKSENYERELVRHGETIKTLTDLREQHRTVAEEVSQAKASAAAAKTAMDQQEESWSTTRDRYERELQDVMKSRDDTRDQNRVLHTQLENVSEKVTELSKLRGDQAAPENEDDFSNLNELIRYLRREKDIVDIQYSLSTQEATRYKQQLDYTQNQLDEARIKLDAERQRQVDSENRTTTHSKMLETLNELNVYRESNSTLRSEAERLRTRVDTQTQKINELQAKLEPLQASVNELENNLETAKGEQKLLQEDRDRWQKRNQDILHKYDRIDPAELEELRQKVMTLETERQALASASDLEEAKTKLADVEAQLKQAVEAKQAAENATEERITAAKKEQMDRIQEQFKARSKTLNQTFEGEKKAMRDGFDAEKKAMQEKLDQEKQSLQDDCEDETKVLRDEIEGIQADLQTARRERDDALQKLAALPSAGDSNANATTAEDGEVMEVDAPAADTQNLEQECQQLRAKVSELEVQIAQLDQMRATISDLESQVAAKTAELQSKSQNANVDDEHLSKLRADLQAAQGEVEALKAAGPAPAPTEGLSDADAAILEKKLAEVEERYTQRVNSMKASLNEKLGNSRKEFEAEKTKLQDKIKELEDQHRSEIESLKQEHAKSTEARNDNATTTTKGAQDIWEEVTNWGPNELRTFMSKNEPVRRLVGRNVADKVRAREEELTKALADTKAELEGQIEKTRITTAEMESKKWKIKINLAETKSRKALAKIEVFEKAAQHTPQKPVVEVWAMVQTPSAPPSSSPKLSASTTQPSSPPQKALDSTMTDAAQLPAPDATPTVEPSGEERPLGKAPSRPSSRQGMRRGSSSIPQPGRPALAGAAATTSAASTTSTTTGSALPQPAGRQSMGGPQGGAGRGNQRNVSGRGGFGFGGAKPAMNPQAGNFTPSAAPGQNGQTNAGHKPGPAGQGQKRQAPEDATGSQRAGKISRPNSGGK